MKLYDILHGLRVVEAMIDNAGGEITPETEAALAGLEGSLETKCDNIAALIDEAEADVTANQDRANRFAAKARMAGNKADRLKEWLKGALEAAGRDKVKGERFAVAVQQNSAPSIRWDGEPWTMPEQFTRIRVEPDGDRIKEAHKAGTLPEGFTVKRGTHLRIR